MCIFYAYRKRSYSNLSWTYIEGFFPLSPPDCELLFFEISCLTI